jgi:hypothetical protein
MQDAAIRESKSLLSGQLAPVEDASESETYQDDRQAGVENDELPDKNSLPPANDGPATGGEEDGDMQGHKKSARGLVKKGSSLLADATHISMPLYRHPKQRQRWGDTQIHPVKEWGELAYE